MDTHCKFAKDPNTNNTVHVCTLGLYGGNPHIGVCRRHCDGGRTGTDTEEIHKELQLKQKLLDGGGGCKEYRKGLKHIITRLKQQLKLSNG